MCHPEVQGKIFQNIAGAPKFSSVLAGFKMATSLDEDLPMDIDEGTLPTSTTSVATPPDKMGTVSVQEVSGAMSGLALVDTPKSSRSHRKKRGKKFRQGMEGRVLFGYEEPKTQKQPVWSDEEVLSLLGFLMIFTDGKSWVAHKDVQFWNQAGAYIQHEVKTPYIRSGM